MNKNEIQFINDVLKPWDELNDLLAKPYVYEPGINDIVRMTGNLAIVLKHQCDLVKGNRSNINKLSPENAIMSDVADMVKHRKLNNKERENDFHAIATFEYFEDENENKIKFLRTISCVEYRDKRKFDFILESAKALNFWIDHLKLRVSQNRVIKTCDSDFHNEVILYYNPSKCIRMKSTRIQVYKKDENGNLRPCSPKNVKIGIAEMKINI